MEGTVKMEVSNESLDIAIEKASRLIELLREVQQIIGSLSGKEESES